MQEGKPFMKKEKLVKMQAQIQSIHFCTNSILHNTAKTKAPIYIIMGFFDVQHTSNNQIPFYNSILNQQPYRQ